jgi:hypothetical protein
MSARTAIFIILLTAAATLKGQHSGSIVPMNAETAGKSLPDEMVHVTTDRDIYIAGERIYMYAVTYEGNWFMPVAMSSVLYAELYSQENRVISRNKLVLKNGRGTGLIEIPRNMETGIYFLRAYTSFMKNFGVEQFFVMKLKIVNPYYNSTLSQAGISDSLKTSFSVLSIDSLKVDYRKIKTQSEITLSVKTDKKTYNNREEVRVAINASDNNDSPVRSRFVVTAVLAQGDQDEVISSSAGLEVMAAGLMRSYHEIVNVRFLPETRGDIITGKLIYEDNKPAAGIEVLQSFTGKAACIESSKTDINGNFYFLTDNENNRGDLILKVLPEGKKIILITGNEFSEMFPLPLREPVTLSRSEAELVAREFINLQVEDVFKGAELKKDITGGTDMIPFYGEDYNEYIFSDYARLPNMKEYIFEVILGVIVSKEFKSDKIRITDMNSNDLGPDPLIMIDGVPVSYAPLVLGLDPAKVKLVRVVRSKYFYKKQVYDGILDILTFDEDARSINLPEGTYRYSFIHPGETKAETGPEFTGTENGRVHVFKNLLYWNTDVQTDDKGEATVSFFTPDNTGDFKIKCFGFTDDGRAGEGSCSITVSGK